MTVIEGAHRVARRVNTYGRLDLEHEVSELVRFGMHEEDARRAVDLCAVRGTVLKRTDNSCVFLLRPPDWRAELAAIDEIETGEPA
ncbi:hypothetical protein OJ997_27675 [Solirubrobacter phytolaccae]|uniref:Uncharacterized protein n=1 Tax=Solirubrobacter phytolaccae TaxID=1404360 RepID=A0A9X3NCF1_9ACTN|nr:hypothetical protein [Solirubrobacter phytolaccae]MDA0184120.1 hypothetical protein [Solirubrobacter phytolaccae]